MSKTAPADLVVTFRSIQRRLTEALGDEPAGAEAKGLLAELQQAVVDAAAVVGSPSAGDAVADAIRDRPADAWTVAELDSLRDQGLEIGRLLRRIQAARDSEPS